MSTAFTVPNLISLVRMALIPLFIIAVLDGQPLRAFLIFLAAGVTDALDGFIARAFHQQSTLGAYLDPIADKLLLMSAYVMLAIPGLAKGTPIPLWVTVLVIARDILIVAVALVLYLALGITRFRPSWLSKVNTGAQLAGAILALGSGVMPSLRPVVPYAALTVATLTVASGLDYIRRVARMSATTA